MKDLFLGSFVFDDPISEGSTNSLFICERSHHNLVLEMWRQWWRRAMVKVAVTDDNANSDGDKGDGVFNPFSYWDTFLL